MAEPGNPEFRYNPQLPSSIIDFRKAPESDLEPEDVCSVFLSYVYTCFICLFLFIHYWRVFLCVANHIIAFQKHSRKSATQVQRLLGPTSKDSKYSYIGNTIKTKHAYDLTIESNKM